MPVHDVRDRHVVVTGGSSGIGAAIAEELGRRGARVGLVARRAPALDEVVPRIEEAGGRAAARSADVTDHEAVATAIGELEEALGPVYGLVANAGLGLLTTKGRVKAERDDSVLRVNVDGVIHAVGAVQRGMLERREGFLAAVSSLAAWRGLPNAAAYSASKAAVSSFMESLRVDLRRKGITVTTVHPGFVRTAMTADNRFHMPFLVESADAARIAVDGILRGRRQVNFPWQLALAMRAVRRMPGWLYDRVVTSR